MKLRLWVLAISAPLALGCGDDGGGASADAGPGTDAAGADAAVDPNSLRLTGLWSDFAAETLADGVMPYEPQFQLWTDGATKRRWVWLPEGGVIDTTNPDQWKLPIGAKLWKEFTRDGKRIETRLIEKTGDTDFTMSTYAWNEEGTDAILVEGFQGVKNALGTDHDIPGPDDCNSCHGRMPQIVLGFSAIQLDFEPGDAAMVNIDDLDSAGLLSASPPGNLPHYPLPGNAIENAALGYVLANCGHCHNATGFGTGVGDPVMDFTLSVNDNNFGQTGLAAVVGQGTTIGVVGYPAATTIADAAGDPDASAMYVRMKQDLRGTFGQMPQIGTELEDTTGLAAIAAWIESL